MQVIGDLCQSVPLSVYILKRGFFGRLLRCRFVDLGQSVSSCGSLSHSEWFFLTQFLLCTKGSCESGCIALILLNSWSG